MKTRHGSKVQPVAIAQHATGRFGRILLVEVGSRKPYRTTVASEDLISQNWDDAEWLGQDWPPEKEDDNA